MPTITFTDSKNKILKPENNTFDELWCFVHLPHQKNMFQRLAQSEQYLLIPGNLIERFVAEYPVKMQLSPKRTDAAVRHESAYFTMGDEGYAYAQKLEQGLARECIPFAFWEGNRPSNYEFRRFYMTTHVLGKKVDYLDFEAISKEKFFELANQFL